MSIKSFSAKLFAKYIVSKTQKWSSEPEETQQKVFEYLISSFNYLLRDWRTGEIGDIFRGVFDQLFWLHRALDSTFPFEVVSGFRSISTNKMLETSNEGVAKNSLHTYGMAIDIKMKNFIYKMIIATIFLIILFEFIFLYCF